MSSATNNTFSPKKLLLTELTQGDTFFSNYIVIKKTQKPKHYFSVGEMAHLLGVFAALAKDPYKFPTSTWHFTNTCNTILKGSASIGSHTHVVHVYMYIKMQEKHSYP